MQVLFMTVLKEMRILFDQNHQIQIHSHLHHLLVFILFLVEVKSILQVKLELFKVGLV